MSPQMFKQGFPNSDSLIGLPDSMPTSSEGNISTGDFSSPRVIQPMSSSPTPGLLALELAELSSEETALWPFHEDRVQSVDESRSRKRRRDESDLRNGIELPNGNSMAQRAALGFTLKVNQARTNATSNKAANSFTRATHNVFWTAAAAASAGNGPPLMPLPGLQQQLVFCIAMSLPPSFTPNFTAAAALHGGVASEDVCRAYLRARAILRFGHPQMLQTQSKKQLELTDQMAQQIHQQQQQQLQQQQEQEDEDTTIFGGDEASDCESEVPFNLEQAKLLPKIQAEPALTESLAMPSYDLGKQEEDDELSEGEIREEEIDDAVWQELFECFESNGKR